MKTCIIFGGNGFIGSHLAEGLVHEGYEVKVFDTFQSGTANLKGIINDIELIKGDFLIENDVNKALEDVDYLFHYISTTNPVTAARNPIYDIESNIIGSFKLFQNAVEKNIEKIIFPSSGGTIYGDTTGKPIKETAPLNPVNPYAISKLTIENYLQYFKHTYGIDYLILRYSNLYGERQNPLAKQGVISIFLNMIKNNEKTVIYGDGSAIRDYSYINDAIDATLAVLRSKTKKKIFNIGSGQGTSLNQLIDLMSKVTNKKVSPEYVEDSGIYLSKIVLDISRIIEETGWKPTTELDLGLEITWNWIKAL